MTPLIIGLIEAETQTKTTGVDLKPEGIVIPTPNFTIVVIILGIQEKQNPVTVTRRTREVFIFTAHAVHLGYLLLVQKGLQLSCAAERRCRLLHNRITPSALIEK